MEFAVSVKDIEISMEYREKRRLESQIKKIRYDI